MSYTYDYTGKPTDEGIVRPYWRFLKMRLTRCLRNKTFRFDSREYEYLYHPYNRTWKNERGVEIPIFREILVRHHGARILEIGNVLSHYFSVQHDIVDKYEVSPGVINQDIIEFTPQRQYDLIVSISTLEHVGWDEQPQDPPKLLRAIEHVRSTCLAPGGMLVASLPIGYNRYFDDLLDRGTSPFTTHHFLKRISKRNYWREADWAEVRHLPYGRFVAQAIVIGIISGQLGSDNREGESRIKNQESRSKGQAEMAPKKQTRELRAAFLLLKLFRAPIAQRLMQALTIIERST